MVGYLYIGPEYRVKPCAVQEHKRRIGEKFYHTCCEFYCPGDVDGSCPFCGEEPVPNKRSLFAVINDER